MYHIDDSQTITNMDSFNAMTTLAGQSSESAPGSPLGILILCCCLKNLTELELSWLLVESTPRAPFDDVSSSSASK